MEQSTSYLQRRVYEEMGVTPEQNKIKVITYNQFDIETLVETPIFSSDDKDNIDILVYTLDRKLIRYDHPKADPTTKNPYNDREQVFKLKRLKEPKGDMKYVIPKGVGTYPFFPPSLVEKYEKGEQIKTLVITEGYFKAFKAHVHGWDIVGLSSITHYANKKTKQIHPDIAVLIKRCKVQNVVMLYDGDCLNISTSAIEQGTDLRERPYSFFQSMLKIRELLVDYDVKVYFSHILSENIEGNPKGLDDLLIAQPGKEDEILQDLMLLGTPGHYFYRLNVSTFGRKLQAYFNLTNADVFYGAWGDIIGNREFEFYGTKYQYDGQKLKKTVPAEAKNYVRVGDEYYEIVDVPNMFGDNEKRLYKRKKTTISDDYGRAFIENIAKYKAFINIPSHTNYQRVINNCYNKYSPIPHEPEEGDWSTTRQFIEHIFGEHFEYGLDYIQILYQHPTQILPILCLVSKENQTGKTTFLDFLKLIFADNACKVGNAELSNEFNSYTATRLVVGVDETFLEKKTTIEKIKMLSTSNQLAMQRKGIDHEEINHFAKYILVSNNEDSFISAGDEDIRYWVRKVPVLQNLIPNIMEMLNEEIPAFLYFLSNRKISVPNTSRAWFDPKLLETEALQRLRKRSKPMAQREITGLIRSMFIDFKKTEIRLAIEDLKERCDIRKYENSYLKIILTELMKVEYSKKVTRYKIPYWDTDPLDDDNIVEKYHKKHGRPFIFRIGDFLSKSEMIEIGYQSEDADTEYESVSEKLPF